MKIKPKKIRKSRLTSVSEKVRKGKKRLPRKGTKRSTKKG